MLFKESEDYRYERAKARSGKMNDIHNHITPEDAERLNHYATNSASLTHSLIHGEELSREDKDAHEAIQRNAKPIGLHGKIYSGVSVNLGNKISQLKSGDVLHSPAHISTTHMLDVAHAFSSDRATEESLFSPSPHIISIDVQPHNKVCHIKNDSVYSEHESILPAGTKLKYSHTTSHRMKLMNNDMYGPDSAKYKVHHFTIHSQE